MPDIEPQVAEHPAHQFLDAILECARQLGGDAQGELQYLVGEVRKVL
jgi:hypothetical protein